MSDKEFASRAAKAVDLNVHFSTNRSYREDDNAGNIKDWECEKEEIGLV
jgi:hypothetical protein